MLKNLANRDKEISAVIDHFARPLVAPDDNLIVQAVPSVLSFLEVAATESDSWRWAFCTSKEHTC
jgi:hypothetical protein